MSADTDVPQGSPGVKHVAILGGGASGLIAIRSCLEEGFRVTCFEMQRIHGGLWRFREEDTENLASVMKSTIINSSKEMSAFSDFPPPSEYPNYMHNSMMIKYIELYAEHYGLTEYIKFRHEVIRVEKADDYDSKGRWKVKVRDLDTNNEFEEVFDGVMVCTGHHVFANNPKFEGMDKFKGKIMHSHSYKRPRGFEDKNVLVVGIGNSGGDIAVETSQVADKVYLSTRRGCWIIHRVGPWGLPFDAHYIRRWWNVLFGMIPYDVKSILTERVINERFDHAAYNLKPRHHIFGQHPMVNDALPNRILSGTVVIKSDVKHFTPSGVVFEREPDKEYPIDMVVLATGYDVKFPFIPKEIVSTEDNICDLYKYVFPPNLKHPSLAFIGLAQPVGPLFPISEIQSRWFVQLMAGKVLLPTEEKMRKDIKANDDAMGRRYFEGPRNTLQMDWLPYMDMVASLFGAKPNMTKLLFTDPRLYWECLWGPCLPYQYRIHGPHPWAGARDAILEYPTRVLQAFKTRGASDKTKSRGQTEEQFRLVQLLKVFFLMAFLAMLLAVF